MPSLQLLLLASCVVAGIGTFVNDPVEEQPTATTTERRFVYRGEAVDAKLSVQSPTGLCDPDVKQRSGYFSFGANKKQYFYWLFESRHDPANDPTVMWLTGGPGCSSMMGLLFENGPCAVNADGASTTLNPYSWNTRANVMWVDQPPGTGFSMGAYDHDEDGVAEDMYQFLQTLFQALPQYNKKFFVTGESYAGHYIPAVTHRIFQGNNALAQGDVKIELEGMAIGNGLTDPEEQIKWYPDMMCNGGGYAPPVINSSSACAELRAAVPTCQAALAACNSPAASPTACATANDVCTAAFEARYEATGMNPYDQRLKCARPPLCYDMSKNEKFLNDQEVQRQLGVDRHFQSCSDEVGKHFTLDLMKNYHQLIPPMLAAGIDVLIYAGDQDFICNWLGNEKWTLALDWEHRDAFNAADKKPFLVGGREVAELRSHENFHFLRVYQAGHMVPLDQPEAALGVLDALLDGTFRNKPTTEVLV